MSTQTVSEIVRKWQLDLIIDANGNSLKADGIPGPVTQAAIASLFKAPASSVWPPWPPVAQSPVPAPASPPAPIVSTGAPFHRGIATSFADPDDISAFKACKAEGKTDDECFAVGDNGIGKWGDATGPGTGLGCALPPEDWEQFGSSARGKGVVITANGRTVTAKLVDTMPHRANIHNGAIIDLTTDTCLALGLEPPLKEAVSWRWV